MRPEVKFCGLTRAEDLDYAVELGAAFAGVILAGGPRRLTPERAAALMAPVRGRICRVVVVDDQPLAELERLALTVGPEVLQLHSNRPADTLPTLRDATGSALWVVLNARDGTLPPDYDDALRGADAIVLDSIGRDGLGGSGRPADWERVARTLAARGRPKTLVLAGGLRAENVAVAIDVVAPDIVDVSSGVEAAPGVKDHRRMAEFRRMVGWSAPRVTS